MEDVGLTMFTYRLFSPYHSSIATCHCWLPLYPLFYTATFNPFSFAPSYLSRKLLITSDESVQHSFIGCDASDP